MWRQTFAPALSVRFVSGFVSDGGDQMQIREIGDPRTHTVPVMPWKRADPKVLGIIPARGGSKGIPMKNLAALDGRPLLAWTIEDARESKITTLAVSTDSEKIAQLASTMGAEAIQRPPELSTDHSPSEDALIHVLDVLGPSWDVVVMLQATSPLRPPGDIDQAIEWVYGNVYDSVVSVVERHQFVWQSSPDGAVSMSYNPTGQRPRRQDSIQFVENGSIYAFRPEMLQRYRTRLGGKIGLLQQPWWCGYEVDEPRDLELLEWVLKRIHET
jgi:CMP-N,N'-diacetyllegionaminic acid synthase